MMKESVKNWGSPDRISLSWCWTRVPRLDPIPRAKTRAWGRLCSQAGF